MERRKSAVAGCVASPTDSSHVRLRYTYDGMGGDRSSVAMSNRAVLMAAVPKGFPLSRNGEKEKRSCQLRRWPNRLQPCALTIRDTLTMVWAVLGSPDNTSAQSLIRIEYSETTSRGGFASNRFRSGFAKPVYV